MGKRRSVRKGESWRTFTVTVREVRGEAPLYASVRGSQVTGVPGTPYAEFTYWEGVVATREPGRHLEVDEAAEYAARALRNAFPGLF